MESGSLTSADKNDQIMAALAHLTIMLPVMGVIAPIVIWVTQKDKSQFVAFQALQAVIYQLLLFLGYLVGMTLYMCSIFSMVAIAPSLSESGHMDPFALFGLFSPFIIFGLIMIVGIVYILYGIYASIRIFQGHDFRYVLIGKKLEQYLAKSTA
jgi:uncharacterized Tic20 family protein